MGYLLSYDNGTLGYLWPIKDHAIREAEDRCNNLGLGGAVINGTTYEVVAYIIYQDGQYISEIL